MGCRGRSCSCAGLTVDWGWIAQAAEKKDMAPSSAQRAMPSSSWSVTMQHMSFKVRCPAWRPIDVARAVNSDWRRRVVATKACGLHFSGLAAT